MFFNIGLDIPTIGSLWVGIIPVSWTYLTQCITVLYLCTQACTHTIYTATYLTSSDRSGNTTECTTVWSDRTVCVTISAVACWPLVKVIWYILFWLATHFTSFVLQTHNILVILYSDYHITSYMKCVYCVKQMHSKMCSTSWRP